MMKDAQRTINLYLPPGFDSELADDLALALGRGCNILRASTSVQSQADSEVILLLVDDREALAGTLTPADRCQSIVSANRAIVTVLTGYFSQQPTIANSTPVISTMPTQQNDQLDWVAWEDRKQRHLWSLNSENRVA